MGTTIGAVLTIMATWQACSFSLRGLIGWMCFIYNTHRSGERKSLEMGILGKVSLGKVQGYLSSTISGSSPVEYLTSSLVLSSIYFTEYLLHNFYSTCTGYVSDGSEGSTETSLLRFFARVLGGNVSHSEASALLSKEIIITVVILWSSSFITFSSSLPVLHWVSAGLNSYADTFRLRRTRYYVHDHHPY